MTTMPASGLALWFSGPGEAIIKNPATGAGDKPVTITRGLGPASPHTSRRATRLSSGCTST